MNVTYLQGEVIECISKYVRLDVADKNGGRRQTPVQKARLSFLLLRNIWIQDVYWQRKVYTLIWL